MMEIACQPNSLLAAKIQELAQDDRAAVRCSQWNACDLGTNDGVRLILQRLDLEKPTHCWIAPPGSAFSPMQNANQRTEEQKQALQVKRDTAMRIYVGTCMVFHACVQKGIHVTIEMSERCQAWRLPMFAQLRDKYALYEATAKGCRVGLRAGPQEPLLQQGWRILSTHKRLASELQLPCRCPKSYVHARSEGSALKLCEGYTPEFVRRAAQAVMQEHTMQSLWSECHEGGTKSSLPDQFGEGVVCTCTDVHLPQRPRSCGHCCLKNRVAGEGLGGSVGEISEGIGEGNWQVSGSEVEEALVGLTEGCRSRLEAEAQKLLENQDYRHKSMEQFLVQVPWKQQRVRRMMNDNTQGYLILGMYAYGNHYGVTNHTRQLPCTTKYVVQYMQHHAKENFMCTSLALSRNGSCPLHRDVHNHPGTWNRVVGLGPYQGGRLWVQEDPHRTKQDLSAKVLASGEQIQGVAHDVRHRLFKFNPKAWHGPEEWQGERTTVTAFAARGSQELCQEDWDFLDKLGFQMPGEVLGGEQAFALHSPATSSSQKSPSLKQQEEKIKRQLYLLHAATGHGSVKTLVEALKRRQASEQVISLAKQFQCPVCKEKGRIQSRHLASLEALPPKLHTISADIGHWQHPKSGEHVQFMMIIDEGSRFRVSRVLSRGSKQQPNAATCLGFLREGWAQYFGMPRALRVDPAGCFRGEAMTEFCDRNGIYLDIIPADGHWQVGVCEQAVQGVKAVMHKLASDDEDATPETLLAQAVHVFNARDHVRGFSPVQHVFGRSPDITGRLTADPHQVPDELVVESAGEEFEKSARLRAEAEKAHAQWHTEQRISRALNSRAKPVHDYRPGDLIYFWRSQESGQGRRKPGSKQGRYLGPARVLATETRRESDGTLRPGSSVWCVRGRSLLKCCPEQLRRASEREELLEGLAREHGHEETPWTFTKVAEEIGGNQYEDISMERPSEEEQQRAQDVTREVPPTRYRFRGKRAVPEASEDMEPTPEEERSASQGSRPPRPRAGFLAHSDSSQEKGELWTQQVPESAWSAQAVDYWNSPDAAVEVSLDLPENTRSWGRATQNLQGYFIGALKRRAVEVSEKRLSPQELQQFKEAKAIEVKNFIAAEAFQTLPPPLRPHHSQAIGMRWILTWKQKEDGSRKAKARAVLLGYQDPAYEHRATTSPVMTRQSRQMLLQAAANHRWTVHKGDVSGAFLQGRPYPDDLYCIPCDEICRAMNLPTGTVTKLKRSSLLRLSGCATGVV